jgi:hypothetical protein
MSQALQRVSAATWKRSLNTLEKFYGCALEPGLIRTLPLTYRQVLIPARAGPSFVTESNYEREPRAMFVARHGLVDDDGQVLHLMLPRLRKTHKAEHYICTEGQLGEFATGHTLAVAARHYADIPALRHIHEQTVADAFQDALAAALKLRLVRADVESAGIHGAFVPRDNQDERPCCLT